MKIAVSSQGKDIDAQVDPRFGRAAGFIVYDDESTETTYHDNAQNLALAQGAGIQAAMNVSETGAKAVITGHVGPKAFAALKKGNIAVYLTQVSTVKEALDAWKNGELNPADTADKPGHW